MRDSDVILQRLARLHPRLIDLSLDRLRGLLDRLDRPQDHLPPVIHVAGTNGKGSTIANLRAMLEAAGRRVHVYTSPHLVRFAERIRLAGRLIEEAHLVDVLDRCERANDGAPITQFEITTAAAFVAFRDTPADVALVEVGLGGEFDATNVIEHPALCAITPIDYDHQDYLGDTLTKIASAKAGILKPGVTAVIAAQADEALSTIGRVAARVRAPLFVHGEHWSVREEHGRVLFEDEDGLLDLPLPKLPGRHQIANVGTAVACLRRFRDRVAPEVMERGLAQVEWPARLQRLARGPLVDLLPAGAELWLDGAHNPAGARALAEALADMEERSERPLYLIVGIGANKDPSGILPPFAGLARRVFGVPIPDHDSFDAIQIASYASRAGVPGDPAEDVSDAIAKVLRLTGSVAPRIVILGSLYLAGAVLAENG